MPIGDVLRQFVGKDPVLFASAILAVVSMFVNPPSDDYVDFIDVRTLAILLCLMTVVAGISSLGAFDVLAKRMLSGSGSLRIVSGILVALPFFLSMFITNDVSLLTFVPLAIIVFVKAGRRDLIIPVLVFQTAAANLGSILLPFGNPQNIFIDSKYNPGFIDFMDVQVPYLLAGAVVLLILVFAIKGRTARIDLREAENRLDVKRLLVFLALFVICIMAVLRIVDYAYVFIAVILVVLCISSKTFLKVDWGLLLTFVCLFVFAGNIASIDAVNDILSDCMDSNSLVTTAFVSQFISNVPATVMLSNFTSDWSGLLAGASIGGFGTPIASMASIITFRIYSREGDADRKNFLKTFLVLNFLILALLLLVSVFV